MQDRWGALRRATWDAVTRGPGTTPADLRSTLARGDAPSDLRKLVDTIRKDPARVTDADVSALAASYSEDQIFEIVVAATVGVASEKLDRALAALDAAEGP